MVVVLFGMANNPGKGQHSNPSPAGDHDAAAALLNEVAAGKALKSFTAFGPNSIKTLIATEVLIGQSVRECLVTGNQVEMRFDDHLLVFDLQRAGRVSYRDVVDTWAFLRGTQPPTARLLLADGSGVDFVEP